MNSSRDALRNTEAYITSLVETLGALQSKNSGFVLEHLSNSINAQIPEL